MEQIVFPRTLSVTLPDLAKMIDHALLHPTMTDSEVAAGLEIAKKYNVATACVKPYSIPQAKTHLAGSSVAVCPVIGFPHGNSTTEVKVFEAIRAAEAGGTEIDMVINIGKALGEDWSYVADEIRAVNGAVTAKGAILKVIFENDYLEPDQISRLCRICSDAKVGFVKTSTGYGFVKQSNGMFKAAGATLPHLKLMKDKCNPEIRVKAAGGVRTLDDLLRIRALGVARVGTSATEAILEEAKRRGIGEIPAEVPVLPLKDGVASGY